MNQPQQENVQTNPLGENIRKLRVLNSFSQEYVAANLEMSQGNYARMENGDISINSKRLKQIAYVLGYSPEFLKNFDAEKLGSVVEKEEKPVELLNFNISMELKELYEARIKVLETQIETLKHKWEATPANKEEADQATKETDTSGVYETTDLAANTTPTDTYEKTYPANEAATDIAADSHTKTPNDRKANEITANEVQVM